MTEPWRVVLALSCLDAVRSFRRPEQDYLIRQLDWLTENATQPVQFIERSATGKEIKVWLIGRFLISYSLDHGEKEIRVVRIERVKFVGHRR